MKTFTKLALVSSMALSANAFAMQAMDDSALSATTGQDGLSIGIGISKIEIEKLFIHDNDGLDVDGTAGAAGAIVIQGNGIAGDANEFGIVVGANYDDGGDYLLDSRNLADLKIDSDAGAGGGNTAFINIAADVSGLDIKIGEIGVTASGVQGSASSTSALRRGGDENNYNAIISGLSLKTGSMSANIQLGAAPQGAMIKLNTEMLGGLEINNLGILDNSTASAERAAGEIFIESIKIADADAKNLTITQDVRVMGASDSNPNDKGYIQMISHGGAKDHYVQGVHLGSRDAASIGDVEIQGMQTYFSPEAGKYSPGAVITIRGH
ncbi:putative pilus system protein FilA [Acinetobacter indicus]|uniref:putative pilus system protein FilA n=1 Tax=Acinetobacter indicus TaxID=756892 RepID=UPI003989FF77